MTSKHVMELFWNSPGSFCPDFESFVHDSQGKLMTLDEHEDIHIRDMTISIGNPSLLFRLVAYWSMSGGPTAFCRT